MGKRRRKLLRRKYTKLAWNQYDKNLSKEEEATEHNVAKIVEDNSVILERMKEMTCTLDDVIDNLDCTESVEMRIQPHNEPTLIEKETPNFSKMTKKALIEYAKENSITFKTSMTKAQLIKTIEES